MARGRPRMRGSERYEANVASRISLWVKNLLEYLAGTGTGVGEVVLLDLYPKSSRYQDVAGFVHALLDLQSELTRPIRSRKGQRLKQQIHWHVDGKGKVAYLAVPRHWLIEVPLLGESK